MHDFWLLSFHFHFFIIFSCTFLYRNSRKSLVSHGTQQCHSGTSMKALRASWSLPPVPKFQVPLVLAGATLADHAWGNTFTDFTVDQRNCISLRSLPINLKISKAGSNCQTNAKTAEDVVHTAVRIATEDTVHTSTSLSTDQFPQFLRFTQQFVGAFGCSWAQIDCAFVLKALKPLTHGKRFQSG